MTAETIYTEILNACKESIESAYTGSFTAVYDPMHEDGMTYVEITGEIDEEGMVTVWDMTVDSGDYDGNDIVTEAAALADQIDIFQLEEELNRELAPAY